VHRGFARAYAPGLENEITEALPPRPELPSLDDDVLMSLALEEAAKAFEEDEVPIGAVVVDAQGEIVARAHNRTRAECDPSAHAELLAIRAATASLGYQRLDGCTLYTTVEPCFMCAGALVHARLTRVVFGVRDPKFGGTVSLGRVLDTPGLNHHVGVEEGVRADEARTWLQTFFRAKR
jgi:tRNA(adenine34) deaminase